MACGATEAASGGAIGGRGRYAWAGPGDVNAFFGLMLDNVGDMILMSALLVGAYGFPAEFVLTRMIPGTAVGVLVGDLLFTFMAFRLARRTGRSDVTAMPLGLDTPSTFGAVFLVLGPAYLRAQAGQGDNPDPMLSAQHAWYLGIGLMLVSGLFKLACAPLAGWIRRSVPRAGLLGSLVAIALVIISFLPLLEVASAPISGLVALILVLTTLTGGWAPRGRATWWIVVVGVGVISAYLVQYPPSPFGLLPALLVGVLVAAFLGYLLHRAGEVPGALLALVVGGLAYYGLHALEYGPGPGPRPERLAGFSFPFPAVSWIAWIRANWLELAGVLPVGIPLALATVVGGIDCAESAAAVGDDYPTGSVVGAEGLATLVAAFFGGVIQSTPYIGHPAYKAMGGRAAYTLATALFVGAVGLLGLFGWLFYLVPKPAIFPILVFIGIEITQQSFRATERRHYPALVLACVPSLAYLAFLMVEKLAGEVDRVLGAGGSVIGRLGPEIQDWHQVLTVLSAGFIVTSLLWGAWLAHLIDGRWKTAASVLALAGVLSLFGVIHSPLRGSPIAWPGQVVERLRAEGRLEASPHQTPYVWASAYGLGALVVLAFGVLGDPVRRTLEPADGHPSPD